MLLDVDWQGFFCAMWVKTCAFASKNMKYPLTLCLEM